ncbi:MAG: type II toxin-antitoxin system VapC family toxin [Azoarcus sp.]|jgi:PIN domain nuclease of toxin-antitoxin system|nr:type II toxin-antitoxin system VapC family toxin [Azoarcus sp.]
MHLLLDTHVALWAFANSPRLQNDTRVLIEARDNSIYVSAATIWEISIKHAAKRGDMPISGEEAWAYCRESGFRILEITARHASAVGTLPMLHQDPFDRMLIAQALTEPLVLVTHDRQILRYNDNFLQV